MASRVKNTILKHIKNLNKLKSLPKGILNERKSSSNLQEKAKFFSEMFTFDLFIQT